MINRKIQLTQIVTIIALLVLTGSAFSAGMVWSDKGQVDTVQAAQVADGADILAAYEQALVSLYEQAIPAIVYIDVVKTSEERTSRFEGFDFGFPFDDEALPESMPSRGQGSGFVWDNEGHIVTNHHVVFGADEVMVTFADGTAVEATVIGTDPNSDLAVIKIDVPANQLSPLPLGDSDALRVGQMTIALGNPFGQEFTMTSGIVSAIGRTIRSGNGLFSIPQAVQTDAAINPGNSGGPLVDRTGAVIGINTQIISRSGANSGIGFAVPVNIAKDVIPTLIAGEEYEYAWLGISGVAINDEIVALMNLPEGTEGAIILEVSEGGPADMAGLRGSQRTFETDGQRVRLGGDVITAIEGQPVDDMDDLITYLVNDTRPNDVITLSIIREDGETAEVDVTLGTRPTVGLDDE